MPSDIFNSLLEEKIMNYKNKFERHSRNLFTDKENDKLVHPGEFGTYREAITREFLKGFIPYSLDISTGFLINSENQLSTQIDIIIFDLVLRHCLKMSIYKDFSRWSQLYA